MLFRCQAVFLRAILKVSNDRKLTGVLLANTGTPDSPNPKDIKKYLKEFLSDRRIIKIPRIIWLPILYLIILNIRPYKKQKDYKKIWMKDGSPLLVLSKMLLDNIKLKNTNKDIFYSIGMRYGNPSIASELKNFQDIGIDNLLIFPMFPQYSFSTMESIRDEVLVSLKKMQWNPKVNFIEEYYTEEDFINSTANQIQNSWNRHGRSNLLIFTYHGLPKRYILDGDPYYDSCLKTSDFVAKKLNIKNDEYISSFHSKFGFGEWTKPYTENLLLNLPKKGISHVDIISPTFSIDCLETLEEIEIQFKNDFIQAGGKKFNYIPCLNNSSDHINLIENLVNKHLE
ncbi:MAG: ferrochelatase [Pelagibacteraceae bacterium]|nr:ferrochelatase [Pelagibacteraceae bacterium]PPR51990.1 MAG: Ferrochelatase [Alphaproteobacteria bacterium MarineAlpha5_Bin10]